MVDFNYAEKMTASTNQVDKRFIQEYLISKACKVGTRFGFKNDMLLSTKSMSTNIMDRQQ